MHLRETLLILPTMFPYFKPNHQVNLQHKKGRPFHIFHKKRDKEFSSTNIDENKRDKAKP